MKATKLLHKNLSRACPEIHNIRLAALMAAVTSTIKGQQLTATGLGRNLKSYSNTDTKHDIKPMDRIIGNPHLHAERKDIYRYLLKSLIGQQKHPILIADWSPIPGQRIFQLHRISIPMGGRTLMVYEECFEEKKLNNIQVHNVFLDELEALLPEGCQPIILSDTIYKTQWFEKIGSKNWYWVGRVRGNVQLSQDLEPFKSCTEIMKQATSKPKSLGTLL